MSEDKFYFTSGELAKMSGASYKTIEKLGANLIEEVLPPKDYIFYWDGIKAQRIYELKID